MQNRPGRVGVAHHVWRRGLIARRRQMTRQINALNRQIDEEETRLQAWIDDRDNHQLLLKEGERDNFQLLYSNVLRAQDLLQKRVTTRDSQPSLEEVQKKLVDLKALNKGLYENDSTDLLECAKNHLAYKSPLAIALGITLAVIGLSLLIAGAAAALPVLATIGMIVLIVGVAIAAIGFEKVITDNAAAFFNVAKGINSKLDQQKDLMGIDPPAVNTPLFIAPI